MSKIKHESILSQDGLRRSIKVLVPKEEVERLAKDKILELSRTIKINGFRQGKVPVSLINQRYMAAVYSELASGLIEDLSKESITGFNLKPISKYFVDVISDISSADGFSFSVEFDVYPEVPDLDVAAISMPVVKCDITEKDIDKVIEEIKFSVAEYAVVDRGIMPDDKVVLSHKYGDKQGESSFVMHATVPEKVCEELLGKASGACISTNVEDYDSWSQVLVLELQPEAMPIEITVVSVSEILPVDLTVEMWQKAGYASTTIEDLRDEIRKTLELTAAALCDRENFKVLEPLLFEAANKLEFDLPEFFVESVFKDQQDKNADVSLEDVRGQLRRDFVFEKLSSEDVQTKLTDADLFYFALASNFKLGAVFLRHALQNPEWNSALLNRFHELKSLKDILGSVTVESEVNQSLTELMKKREQES